MRYITLLFVLGLMSFITKGQTPVATDPIQYYISGKKIYEFSLTAPEQMLELGELACDTLHTIRIKIINDTGAEVSVAYREHDAAVIWWPKGRYDLLKPGEFMILRPECLRPMGQANANLNIPYTINEVKHTSVIKIRASLLYPRAKLPKSMDTPTVQKQEETPKISLPEKKEPPPAKDITAIQPNQAKRASCADRYKNKVVYSRDSLIKTYEFNIYNKQKQRSNENDLFDWGELTAAQDGEEYIFRFKNNQNYPLYITDVQCAIQNLMIKNIGKSILLPDSSAVFSLRVDINQADEFYGAINFRFSNGWEKKTYNLTICGYHPEKVAYGKRPHYQKRDSLAIYLYDKNQKTHGEYTLQIIRNDSVSYPKFKSVNKEFVCHIPYKYNDIIWYSITDKSKKVIRKGHFKIADDDRVHFIPVNDVRQGLHTYIESEGPYEYRMVKDMYFIRPDKGYMKEEDFNAIVRYFDSLGIYIETKRACLPYITMTDKKKLIELQNRIISSKHNIVLCPVQDSDAIDPLNGWGGGCNYYINDFYIGFNKNVTQDKAQAILKQQGITDYTYLKKNEYGLSTYTFSLPILVDFEYIKTLDRLYDLPEVRYIEHGMSGMAGLD